VNIHFICFMFITNIPYFDETAKTSEVFEYVISATLCTVYFLDLTHILYSVSVSFSMTYFFAFASHLSKTVFLQYS
jgi:hypothetical protein